jgi:acetolactate synthase-1/2/3 large subunit
MINPDFVALAKAHGAHAELVVSSDEFAAAFERAMQAGRPAVIEVQLDPEILTPSLTVESLRNA